MGTPQRIRARGACGPGARMLARSEQVYACPHRAGESLLPLVGAERAPAARPAWQDVLAARAAEAEALAGEEAAAEAAAAATAGQDVTAAAASALLAAGVDLGAVTARPRASRARLGYLYPISTLSMTRPRAGRTRQDAAAGGRSGSQYHLGRMRTPLRMRKPVHSCRGCGLRVLPCTWVEGRRPRVPPYGHPLARAASSGAHVCCACASDDTCDR